MKRPVTDSGSAGDGRCLERRRKPSGNGDSDRYDGKGPLAEYRFNAGAKSEKRDKNMWHSILRSRVRQRLATGDPEECADVHRREVSGSRGMSKDEKGCRLGPGSLRK